MQDGKASLVFIVDDEAVIAQSLAVILDKSGYSARAFTVPFEALHQAMTSAPDLLLSDVMMPGMSGIELAMAIKEICPDCRILLFSGQDATRELDGARERGYDFPLLVKPVHPADLLRRISALA